jgi:predicted GNAT family N-acyltransferase
MTIFSAIDRTGSRMPRGERVTVVRTLDDLQRIAVVRGIVYIADQDCPYDEEFDGNDLCALHLIGWVRGEPVATLRLRFFAGFAKLERLAVTPAERRSAIAFRLVREGLRIAARKGYTRAYGHARMGLEPFWSRFGARPMGRPGGFSFSGQRYTEMVVELTPDPKALTLGMDPLVLARPEGDWDRPGILERSPGKAMEPAGSTAPPPSPEDPASMPDGWSQDTREAWLRFAGGRLRGLREEGSRFAHRADIRVPRNLARHGRRPPKSARMLAEAR